MEKNQSSFKDIACDLYYSYGDIKSHEKQIDSIEQYLSSHQYHQTEIDTYQEYILGNLFLNELLNQESLFQVNQKVTSIYYSLLLSHINNCKEMFLLRSYFEYLCEVLRGILEYHIQSRISDILFIRNINFDGTNLNQFFMDTNSLPIHDLLGVSIYENPILQLTLKDDSFNWYDLISRENYHLKQKMKDNMKNTYREDANSLLLSILNQMTESDNKENPHMTVCIREYKKQIEFLMKKKTQKNRKRIQTSSTDFEYFETLA